MLILLAVIVLLFAVEVLFSPGGDKKERGELEPMPQTDPKSKIIESVRKYARIYNLDPTMMFAFIDIESKWNPNAVGDNGKAFGLFQIWEITYRTILQAGYSTIPEWKTSIDGNVKCAAIYMHWLLIHYNIPDGATLREYWVLGPGNYSKGLRSPEERLKYLQAYERYRE